MFFLECPWGLGREKGQETEGRTSGARPVLVCWYVSTHVRMRAVPENKSSVCASENESRSGGTGPCPSVTPRRKLAPRKQTRWSCFGVSCRTLSPGGS